MALYESKQELLYWIGKAGERGTPWVLKALEFSLEALDRPSVSKFLFG